MYPLNTCIHTKHPFTRFLPGNSTSVVPNLGGIPEFGHLWDWGGMGNFPKQYKNIYLGLKNTFNCNLWIFAEFFSKLKFYEIKFNWIVVTDYNVCCLNCMGYLFEFMGFMNFMKFMGGGISVGLSRGGGGEPWKKGWVPLLYMIHSMFLYMWVSLSLDMMCPSLSVLGVLLGSASLFFGKVQTSNIMIPAES